MLAPHAPLGRVERRCRQVGDPHTLAVIRAPDDELFLDVGRRGGSHLLVDALDFLAPSCIEDGRRIDRFLSWPWQPAVPARTPAIVIDMRPGMIADRKMAFLQVVDVLV